MSREEEQLVLGCSSSSPAWTPSRWWTSGLSALMFLLRRFLPRTVLLWLWMLWFITRCFLLHHQNHLFFVLFQINNPMSAVCNVTNASQSTRLLASTTLRNTLGTKTLQEILADREDIAHNILSSLDAATDPWGIRYCTDIL